MIGIEQRHRSAGFALEPVEGDFGPGDPLIAPGHLWCRRYRRVRSPDDPIAAALLDAIRFCRPVGFRYGGGSSPHGRRAVLPALLFTTKCSHPETSYCLAWCGTRRACRLFRLDRMIAVDSGDLVHAIPTFTALAEIEMEIRQHYRIRGDTVHFTKLPNVIWGI